MPEPLRLGVAGLGTVGAGLVELIGRNGALVAARAGRMVVVTAVSARDRSRDRGVDLSGLAWGTPEEGAARDDVDCLVELVGGEDGPARAAVETALRAGKPVVTANKALLAIHGQALAELAESQGAALRYEAAVAGGIPCIKTLGEGLVGNRITRVAGVMNGTCNYILTRMETAGLPYEEVFEEARALGYLEADPTLDVGGIDAAHKLAILAAAAFGTSPAFADVEIEGIERVTIEDIRRAGEMGYRIKLLGVARQTGRGLEQRMAPCLVPRHSPPGQLEGATNMVILEGDAAGQIVLRGAGAGAGPTASAVLADVIDVAKGAAGSPVFGIPAGDLVRARAAVAAAPVPWYVRLLLSDRPGALAKVAACFGDAGVSIDRLRQPEHDGPEATVIVVTHRASPGDIAAALDAARASRVLAAEPVALRIEEF